MRDLFEGEVIISNTLDILTDIQMKTTILMEFTYLSGIILLHSLNCICFLLNTQLRKPVKLCLEDIFSGE